MQAFNNRDQRESGSRPSSSAFGIAKPTEVLKSSSEVQKRNQSGVLDKNSTNVYTSISNKFQDILNWKASIEVSMKHKEKRIQDLLHEVDLQRGVMLKLQLENEKLSIQSTEELKMRKEVMQKFGTTRELAIALKKHLGDIKKQLNFALESRDMIDKRNEENVIKYKDLIVQYDELKISHLQEISAFKNAIDLHQQRGDEIEQSYNAKFAECTKQIEALSDALEQKEQELNSCRKVMLDSKTHFENIQKEKGSLQSEVLNLKTSNTNLSERINELECYVSKLEVDKKELEGNYQSACKAYSDLQNVNSDIMDKLKKSQDQYSANSQSLNELLREIQTELSHEQQRTVEANAKCELYKDQILSIEAEKIKLETQIANFNEKMEKQDALLKEKELELEKNVKEMCQKENTFQLKLEDTEKKVEAKVKENQSLRALCEELKEEKFSLEEEILKIRMKLDEKDSEIKVHFEKETDIKDKLLQIQKTYSFLETEKSDLEQVLRSTQEELLQMEEVMKLHSSLEETVVDKENKIKELKAELTDLKIYTCTLDDDCTFVTNKVKDLEGEIKKRDALLLTKQEEILKLTKSLEEHSVSFNDLEEKYISVQEELQVMKKALTDDKNEHKSRELKIKKIEDNANIKDELVQKLKMNVSDLKKELCHEKDKISLLDMQINEKDKELSKQKNEVSLLDKQINGKDEELSKLKNEIALLDEQINEKNKELSKQKNELSRAKEEGTSDQNKQEIEQLRVEKNIYLKKWMELQRDHTKAMIEKASEITSLRKEINMIKRQESLKPLNTATPSVDVVQPSDASGDKKLDNQNSVTQETGKKIENRTLGSAVNSAVFQRSLANHKLLQTPNIFRRLPNRNFCLPKPVKKDDPFDTSGSDYMEIEDITGDGPLKLVPSKKSRKKAVSENKTSAASIFSSSSALLGTRDQKNAGNEKKADLARDLPLKLIPSQKSEKKAVSENKASSSSIFSSSSALLDTKDQKNANNEKKADDIKKPTLRSTPERIPSFMSESKDNVKLSSTNINRTQTKSPRTPKYIRQKKKVRFDQVAKKDSKDLIDSKENTFETDFKEDTFSPKRKISSPHARKGKAAKVTGISSLLSSDPFDPFFFE